MYIVAIAWLYVVLMMAITERSVVAGVMTFVFYGLLPCSLLLWLVGTPARRRAKVRSSMPDQPVNPPDAADTKGDQ
jgi:hypothetical protein